MTAAHLKLDVCDSNDLKQTDLELYACTGGSAVASDAIHREVQLLKSKGKPVVVSMGNVAASGGYYIAAPATAIVAEPGTITGSIGDLTLHAVLSTCLQAGDWCSSTRLAEGVQACDAGNRPSHAT